MSKQIGIYLDPIMNPGGVKFPVKRGTWDFIEQAWIDGIRSSMISQIGNKYSTSSVYILYGCVVSSTLGVTNVSSGALFFNGEIFQHSLQSFSDPSGGNVVIANMLSTSWQPIDANGDTYADPVNFIGSSPSNIHIDRTVSFLAGASGSGNLTGNSNSDYINMIKNFSDIGLVFGSGCINATGFYPVTYQIIKDRCFLSGAITGTSLPSSATILTLPVIARPNSNVKLFALTDGAIASFNTISINTSGVLIFNSSGSLSGNIYLDGLNFQI